MLLRISRLVDKDWVVSDAEISDSMTKVSLGVRAWEYSSHEQIVCDVWSSLKLNSF